MHIHIATVGEAISVVMDGIRSISGIEKVYLIHAAKYQENAQRIADYLRAGNLTVNMVSVDRNDYEGVVNCIAGISSNEFPTGPHRYSMNITGGSKLMAYAAMSSAFFLGADVYYVRDDDGSSLEDKLLPIVTAHASKTSKADRKATEILKYIFEEGVNRTTGGKPGAVNNHDIELRFDMKKQQVSYYIKNLRADGLITTENGYYEEDSKSINFRSNSIRVTQQGMMEARFAH